MSRFGFHRKILITSILSVCLIVGVLANLYSHTQRLNKFQAEAEASQEMISKLNHINTLMVDMETGVRGFMLSGVVDYLEPYNKGEAEFEEFIKKIENHPEHKKTIEKIRDLKKKWIEEAAMGEMLARRKLSANRISLEEFTNTFKASRGKSFTDEIRKEVKKSVDLENVKIISLREKILKITKQVTVSSAIVILVVLFSFGAIVYISKIIFRQMSNLSLNLENVSSIVENASSSMAKVAEDLSVSMNEQSQSIFSTCNVLNDISQMAKRSSDNAKSSTTAAINCNQLAGIGKSSVGEMILAVNEIARGNTQVFEEIEKNNEKINAVVKIIMEIGAKTKIINEIVFQTRLLSFNASVEAARAGEQGKGFSIVAEEIGNLASISGEASREISELLEKSEREVKQIVEETKNQINGLVLSGKKRIDESKQVIDQTEKSIDNVVTEVSKINSMLNDITKAITEQESSIGDINVDMNEISKVATETSKLSSDTRNVVASLIKQSDNLKTSIFELKKSIYGRKSF